MLLFLTDYYNYANNTLLSHTVEAHAVDAAAYRDATCKFPECEESSFDRCNECKKDYCTDHFECHPCGDQVDSGSAAAQDKVGTKGAKGRKSSSGMPAKARSRKHKLHTNYDSDDSDNDSGFDSSDDEDDENFVLKSSLKADDKRTTQTRSSTRPERAAAVTATKTLAGRKQGVDYNREPELLYESRVCRTRNNLASGKDEEFVGEVVTDGYDARSKKWHVSYFSDAESEDLNIKDLLNSLYDDTAKPSKTRASAKQSSDPLDDEEDEDADDPYDLSEYLYLKGTTHYDDDDKGVFKVADVQAEDFGDGKGVVVVVYRSKLNETTKKWGKVNMDDPIMVADVEKYYK